MMLTRPEKRSEKRPIGENAIREYVRCYAAPGGMTAGFNYYRNLLPATNPPTREAAPLLPMPVLALGGDHSLGMAMLMSLSQLATQVSGGILENRGHYPAEEQSSALLSRLSYYLSWPLSWGSLSRLLCKPKALIIVYRTTMKDWINSLRRNLQVRSC